MALTLGLGALGHALHHTWQNATKQTPFQGSKAVSGVWQAPPAEAGRWVVSESVEPPPAQASPAELEQWLRRHYPVLHVAHHGRDVAAGDHALDLGGGPPRRLFVEAGVGLVMEEPDAWYARHDLPTRTQRSH